MKTPNDDTIAAVATPAGRGSRAVIRLSGPDAVECVASLAVSGSEALRLSPGFGAVSVRLKSPQGVVPATALVYRAPRSYTREDVVELLVPSSPPVLGGVLESLLTEPAQTGGAGVVRAAGPGEFTLRAFLCGRLDLSQAEAVAQLIQSRGEEEAAASRRVLRGELRERIEALREALVEVLALLEAALDFPDEELPEVSAEQMTRRLGGVGAQLASLCESARLRTAGSDALRVVLAGFPNAGKSSLFNVLVGRPAAIASPLPGTTRDPLRAVRSYGSRRVEWIDLAGMEALPGAEDMAASGAAQFGATDPADAAVWEVVARLTRLELESADKVLWVLDPTVDPAPSLAQYSRLPAASRLLVVQKMDLLSERVLAGLKGLPSDRVCVSALHTRGLEALVRAVLESGASAQQPPEASAHDDAAAPRFLFTSHQQAALSLATDALERASVSIKEVMGYEYAASDVRDVLSALEDLLGKVTPDVILGHVFARFCVGK